jgi:hypothetical protein
LCFKNAEQEAYCQNNFDVQIITQPEGYRLHRDVHVDASMIGELARQGLNNEVLPPTSG